MEAHNRIAFEIKKDDRVYRFDIPNNAPLGEAYEASGHFMDKMVELIKSNRDQQKASVESCEQEDPCG